VSDGPRLTVPRIRVVPVDGEPYVVQATNPDMVAYDMTANRHKWPAGQKAPLLWLNFLAWHAARRTAVIGSDVTFEAFRDGALEITTADDDAVPVDPTEGGADSDY
jgi:hypothetical protein